jgi:hypothetical protein
MFAFVFEEVRETDYRDVLHPSIHGDALHIAMRLRDGNSKKMWVHKRILYEPRPTHFLLQRVLIEANWPHLPVRLSAWKFNLRGKPRYLICLSLFKADFRRGFFRGTSPGY